MHALSIRLRTLSYHCYNVSISGLCWNMYVGRVERHISFCLCRRECLHEGVFRRGRKSLSPSRECILISDRICVFLVYFCVLASLLARACLCFCLCTRVRMTETEKCLIFLRHGMLPPASPSDWCTESLKEDASQLFCRIREQERSTEEHNNGSSITVVYSLISSGKCTT